MDTSFPGDGDVHKQQKNSFDSGHLGRVSLCGALIWRISPQKHIFRQNHFSLFISFQAFTKNHVFLLLLGSFTIVYGNFSWSRMQRIIFILE